MRQMYIERMNDSIKGNFDLMEESLYDARKLLDEGKSELASRELRGTIDGIVQTLELMSAVDLMQNDSLMEDITND